MTFMNYEIRVVVIDNLQRIVVEKDFDDIENIVKGIWSDFNRSCFRGLKRSDEIEHNIYLSFVAPSDLSNQIYDDLKLNGFYHSPFDIV